MVCTAASQRRGGARPVSVCVQARVGSGVQGRGAIAPALLALRGPARPKLAPKSERTGLNKGFIRPPSRGCARPCVPRRQTEGMPGMHAWDACMHAGWQAVWVAVARKSSERVRAANLRHEALAGHHMRPEGARPIQPVRGGGGRGPAQVLPRKANWLPSAAGTRAAGIWRCRAVYRAAVVCFGEGPWVAGGKRMGFALLRNLRRRRDDWQGALQGE